MRQRAYHWRTHSVQFHFHGEGRSDPRPCMDINGISQIALCHHRALNMPARTALAPWRLPVRLSLFLGLPEHKIIRVFLAFFTRYLNLTKARLKLIQVFVGQLAIFCKGTRLKVHRAVLCHIGVSLVDQGLDHIDHSLNLLSCLRMYRSRLHIHILHIHFCTLQYSARK